MDRRTVLATALFLVPACARAAGDEPLDRATLKGLQGVAVVIDLIKPDLQKLGVTREVVLNRLLARLAGDGVKVDPSAHEFLGLRINAVRDGRGPFALSLTIGLFQRVALSRDSNLVTSTETWEVESVMMTSPKLLRSACEETADELADRYATAYHSVNPK